MFNCKYCGNEIKRNKNGRVNKSCAKQDCRGKAKAIGGRKAAKDPRTRIKGSRFI